MDQEQQQHQESNATDTSCTTDDNDVDVDVARQRQPASIYMYPSDEGMKEEEQGEECEYYEDPRAILSGLFTPPSNENYIYEDDNDDDDIDYHGLRLEGEPCAFGPLSFGEDSKNYPNVKLPKLHVRLPPRDYTRSSDTHKTQDNQEEISVLTLEPTLMSIMNPFFVVGDHIHHVNDQGRQADDDLENLIPPPQDKEESKSPCEKWKSASTLCRMIYLIVLVSLVGLAVMGTVCVTTDVCGIGGGDDNNTSTDDSEFAVDKDVFENNNTKMETMSPTLEFTGTASPTSTLTSNPTLVTSSSPTPAPNTPSPTPAPTTWLQSLPDFTTKALQVPMSIQSTAYIWMLKEYGFSRLQGLPAWRQSQIFAILCFYFAFDGADQPGLIRDNVVFDTSLHECEWNTTHTAFGCTEEGRVTTFRVTTSPLDIAGVIPPEVVLLGSLYELAYSSVNLIGNLTSVIPTELTLLEPLLELELSENKLSGTVPEHLLEVTQLERLRLERNRLTGTIPSKLFAMPELIELDLSTNNFRGTIPAPSNLRHLETLKLDYNQLTGLVPSEFGLLTNLRSLSFAGNNLQSIPSELGLLTELKELHVGSLDIPESVCLLTLEGDDNGSDHRTPLQLTIACETMDECPLDCKCSCFMAS